MSVGSPVPPPHTLARAPPHPTTLIQAQTTASLTHLVTALAAAECERRVAAHTAAFTASLTAGHRVLRSFADAVRTQGRELGAVRTRVDALSEAVLKHDTTIAVQSVTIERQQLELEQQRATAAHLTADLDSQRRQVTRACAEMGAEIAAQRRFLDEQATQLARLSRQRLQSDALVDACIATGSLLAVRSDPVDMVLSLALDLTLPALATLAEMAGRVLGAFGSALPAPSTDAGPVSITHRRGRRLPSPDAIHYRRRAASSILLKLVLFAWLFAKTHNWARRIGLHASVGSAETYSAALAEGAAHLSQSVLQRISAWAWPSTSAGSESLDRSPRAGHGAAASASDRISPAPSVAASASSPTLASAHGVFASLPAWLSWVSPAESSSQSATVATPAGVNAVQLVSSSALPPGSIFAPSAPPGSA